MGRRSYAGGADTLLLSSGISSSDLTVSTDPPLGWPDGLSGPFAVVLNKGQTNEEKVLVSGRTGSTFTITIRGYDGTTATDHGPSETFQLCLTGIDLDEANAHINASAGAHGLAFADTVLGVNQVAVVKNKSMSGADNAFTLIPRTASPEIDAALAALTTHDVAQDAATGNTYTKAQTDTAISVETAARVNADSALSVVDTTLAAADTAETAARIAADALDLPLVGGTLTGALLLAADPSAALGAATKQYVDNLVHFVRRTTNQTVANSTALADDNTLTVNVDASGIYLVTLALTIGGTVAAAFKWQLVGPAAATLVGSSLGVHSGATDYTSLNFGPVSLSTPSVNGTIGGGNLTNVQCTGLLVVAGTAGALKLQWAQNTGDATASTIYAGSHLLVRKVG